MELHRISEQMTRSAAVVAGLVRGVDQDQARWRPDAQSWSIVEVVNHLHDEEREDFRAHLDQVLHRPDVAWTPIDPEGWVIRRNYNSRDLESSLENFLAERHQSIQWLHGLASPDWHLERRAPFGNIRAGDLLAAWAAHDLLHIRQLVELHWAYTTRALQPYQVDYAGRW